MAENAIYTVKENTEIANNTYLLRLLGPTSELKVPGQFVNIKLSGFYLRRPFSVCRWDAQEMDVVYKVLGKGTSRMTALQAGEQLDVLTGLGNGFDTAAALGKRTLLIGGGVGVPPMYAVAASLAAQGAPPAVVLGFKTSDEVFFTQEFEALGCGVATATQDGSFGMKGLVTALIEQLEFDYYFACGPTAMLRAVYEMCEQKGAQGQLSFEERMGCGFGACMGCSCHTTKGAARVCVEGPVFSSQEVIFE